MTSDVEDLQRQLRGVQSRLDKERRKHELELRAMRTTLERYRSRAAYLEKALEHEKIRANAAERVAEALERMTHGR